MKRLSFLFLWRDKRLLYTWFSMDGGTHHSVRKLWHRPEPEQEEDSIRTQTLVTTTSTRLWRLLIRTTKVKINGLMSLLRWKKDSPRASIWRKSYKPAPAHKNVEERRLLEAQRVLDQLKDGDVVISLDERGNLWSTEQPNHIQILNQSVKRVVLSLGALLDMLQSFVKSRTISIDLKWYSTMRSQESV